MPLLTCKGLSKSFDENNVFSDVSFELDKGKILLLAGENGSGKSTLLRIIAGQISPDHGVISLQRNWLPPSDTLLIKKYDTITLVNQTPSLSLLKTVEDHIEWELRYKADKSKKQETKKLLAWCNLETRTKQKTQLLSGGELQRLAIALALCTNPKVLLLDEPFSHLDQESILKLLDTLFQLKNKKNLTIIISAHNIKYLTELADYVLCMARGVNPECKPLHEVLKNPINIQEARLTGIINELDAHLVEKLGLPRPPSNHLAAIRPVDVQLFKNGHYQVANKIYFEDHILYKVKVHARDLWAIAEFDLHLGEKVNISVDKNKVMLLAP